MLSPTDQGHFRKYLTTLGVAIVVASLGIGGFLLQTQSDLLVEQDKLAKLTPAARAAIERKQQIVLAATHWAPWVLGALAALGVGLAAWGLVGWQRKQLELDAKDRAELGKIEGERDKIHAELAAMQMTAAEKAEELEQEAEELVRDDRSHHREDGDEEAAEEPETAEPEPEEPAPPVDEPPVATGRDVFRWIARVEDALVSRLASAWPEAELLRDVRPEFTAVDVVLDDLQRDQLTLFELKITDAKNFGNRIRESASAVSTVAEQLTQRYPARTIRSAVILVVREGSRLPENHRRRIREAVSGLKHRPIVVLYGESEWQALEPATLRGDLERRWAKG
ncbi:hypothetical protein Amsp01_080540 [Amycolatopsis sp. NBRC 101858]|uniref:hypothetical protein n=1 Tax=Amycolatopsis sp. NBRC 101858 TaxID=3032200 RepID=UPI0024A11237|nr:hypothetical protein [Amycolatopsis sp. NBRC 101858]GLY42031.1 hypothetical protein Amsp01_080540 [Amycolatopsis sp. NBRC 101858]